MQYFNNEDTKIENKQRKTCSTSNVTRELKTKTVRYHYKLVKWVKSKTLTTPITSNYQWECGTTLSIIIAGGNTKCYSHFGRQCGNFLINIIYI